MGGRRGLGKNKDLVRKREGKYVGGETGEKKCCEEGTEMKN